MAETLETLEDLLDAVHRALLAGDLAALPPLAERIETAMVALPAGADAHGLQTRARRNALLLEAAGRGLRAARRRLEELRGAARLSTYDHAGRRLTLGGAGQVARRA